MIITRTPLRLEFLGGGTDMAYFYDKYPGRILNTAIDRYVHISVSTPFDKGIKIRYSKNELVKSVNEIKHTRVKATLKYFDIKAQNLEITSTADIPSKGTGLGSSSSFTVGLVQALAVYTHKKLNIRQVAEIACEIEIGLLKEPIGKQDQYAAAFGGLCLSSFNKGGKVGVKEVGLTHVIQNNLEKHMLMVYTQQTRSASGILEEQKKDLSKKIPFLIKMASLAKEGEKALLKDNLKEFASILEEEWQVKKNIAPITNHEIEEMYKKAKNLGAWGGRVSGAGGGGFMILIVPPMVKNKLIKYFGEKNIINPRIVSHGVQVISDESTWGKD